MVLASRAGTVIVAVPVLVVSPTEVAVMVTVCAALVAAGAVKVAPVVEVLLRTPATLDVHVTPSGVLPVLLSLVTAAVSVTVWAAVAPSEPSAVAVAGVTVKLMGAELPPQPDRLKAAIIVITNRQTTALIRRPERTKLFRYINTGASQDTNEFVQPYKTLEACMSIWIFHPGFPFCLSTTYSQLPLRNLFTSVS